MQIDPQFSLSALRAITNGGLKGESLPTRIKLLNWGANDSTQGNVLLDEKSASAFSAYQRLIGRERIALDFEHNTVPGTPEYDRTQEPRKVAAYGRPVILSGDGLYLEDLTWTPEGLAAAKNFEDLSATPWRDKDGRVIALHSAALTRTGAVYDLSFFSSNAVLKAELAALSATKTTTTMPLTLKLPVFDASHLTALATSLGLPATATQPEVEAKLVMLVANPAKPADDKKETLELQTLHARLDKFETLLGNAANATGNVQLTALRADLDKLTTALSAQAAASEKTERDLLVAQATRDGKLIPLSAETLEKTSTAVLREMIAKLTPNVVPLNARAKMKEGGNRFGDKKGLELAIAAHESDNANNEAYAKRN